ncbi:MAG: hypothetical protein R3Y63_10250 [Eubacteriales bacterium]
MESILEETLQYFMETHHSKATQDPRTDNAVKILLEKEGKLVKSFSEEQKRFFHEYTDAITTVQWLQTEDLKKMSFVFAMKLRDEVDDIYERLMIE